MPTRHRGEARLTCVLFGAGAVLLQAGCAAQAARVSPSPTSRPAEHASPAGGFTPSSGTIDSEALLQDLRSFENALQSRIEDATDSIGDRTADPQVKRACLLWRNRVLEPVADAISSAEPPVALMEIWTLCLRMKDYLATGDGKGLFGPEQSRAVEAARRSLEMIEDVADKYFPGEQRKVAAQEIRKVASQYPYTGTFDSNEPVPLRLNSPLLSGIKGVIGLPLTPFVAAGKVGEGAASIKDWAPTVSRLTDVLEDYPRSVRWQADRLLLDIDQAPAFRQAVLSINRISDSADQLSRTVSQFQPVADRYADLIESLPADTAGQVKSILNDLDRNETAQSATQSLDRLSAGSEQLIAVAKALPASLQAAMDRSSESAGMEGKDLVDHIAWRAAQVLGLAFVLSALLILLSRLVRRGRV
jgi:hypothetical protein